MSRPVPNMGTLNLRRATTRLQKHELLLLALPFMPFLSGSAWVKWIGLLSLLIVSGVLIEKLLGRRGASSGKGDICFLLLLVVGLLTATEFSMAVISQVLQIALLVTAIRVTPNLNVTKRVARISCISCFGLSSISVIDLISGVSIFVANQNSYGLLGFCWITIILKTLSSEERITRFRSLIWLTMPILLVILSGSRASMLAVLIVFSWIGIVARIGGVRLQKAIAVLIALVPALLVVNMNSEAFDSLRNLAPTVGGKTTFSGRDLIWANIYSAVSDNSFFGFGLGSNPKSIQFDANEGLSAHSGFMQVFFQVGVIGLILYLFAYISVIRSVLKRRDRVISVSIVLGAITIEMFEVVMTQNHFGPGLLLWIAALIVPPERRLL